MSAHTLYADYLRAGLALIPIPRGTKGPTTTGWNLRENAITEPHHAARINGGNLGLAHAWCTPTPTCAIDVDDYQGGIEWLSPHGIDLIALLAAEGAVQIKSGRPNRAKLLYRLPLGADALASTKSPGGAIEFRCATHGGMTMQDVLPPSIHPDTGKPYTWLGNFAAIPAIPAPLYALWQSLVTATGTHDTRRTRQSDSRANDPIYRALAKRGLILRDRKDGATDIVCPFVDQHTGAGGKGDCTYFPPHTGGFVVGKIHCLHSHCEHRTLDEYRRALGLDEGHAPGTGSDASSMIPKALDDFYHYAPDNRCIYLPTTELWACASVDSAIAEWPKNPVNQEVIKPTRWLARHRAVDQLTWHPGRPQVQDGVSVRDGGYVHDGKTRVFNLYRGPQPIAGDATKAGPWTEHVHRIYPETADHIIQWLAHRAQQPGIKINHALVLGGEQGVGKDTLLEPVKAAVAPWNWSEISPSQMLGRFNGWAKAVVVRISEARDLGDTDRFAFYDHSKIYIAAPPDVIRVDEKNLREHQVFNVCGVIITTNHKTDGIYLAPDDRRHHVSWSDATRGDFNDQYWRSIWSWFEHGGIGHVVAYLRDLDLSTFNPKAPPDRTRAFQTIVQANHAPEDAELADLLDLVGNPPAVCLETLAVEAQRAMRQEALEMLTDRRTRRALPHKMERVGYEPVRNPDATDGLFKVGGRRRAIYAKRGLPLADQLRAARLIRYV